MTLKRDNDYQSINNRISIATCTNLNLSSTTRLCWLLCITSNIVMLLLTLFLLVASLFVIVGAEEDGRRGPNWDDSSDCGRDGHHGQCRCPPRQSLVYRSSAEPPYCQRIYFPGCNSIRCPEGYVGTCFGSVATHKVSCPRRRPHKCPNGFWLVRGTQGRFNCVKVARPCASDRACKADEYAVCIKARPANDDCRGREFEERRLEESDEGVDF